MQTILQLLRNSWVIGFINQYINLGGKFIDKLRESLSLVSQKGRSMNNRDYIIGGGFLWFEQRLKV